MDDFPEKRGLVDLGKVGATILLALRENKGTEKMF